MWLYHKRQQFYRRSIWGFIILGMLVIIGCGEIKHTVITDGIEREQEVSNSGDTYANTPTDEASSETQDENTTAVESITNISLEKVKIAKVVDGDTVWVTYGNEYSTKIRLIGIDTAESVHADTTKNNEYGDMASSHTKELLSDYEYVYLEYDKEREDKYGRTLAYIWLSEDTSDITNMLNYRIVMDGYANVLTIAPNNKYSEQFTNIRDIDKAGRIGLWQYEEFQNLW